MPYLHNLKVLFKITLYLYSHTIHPVTFTNHLQPPTYKYFMLQYYIRLTAFQHCGTSTPFSFSPLLFSSLIRNLVSWQFKAFSPTISSLFTTVLEWWYFYKILRNLQLVWTYVSIQVIFFLPTSKLAPFRWDSILKVQNLFIKMERWF